MTSGQPTYERLGIADGTSHLLFAHSRPRGSELATILYLHGFGSSQGGSKASFFRQCALDAGLGFCSLDFQGHGGSGGSMRELTLSRNLADAEAVHAELGRRGIGPVVLLGSSMGGLTALWYAALHPEKVVAALTVAPALDMGKAFAERIGPRALRAWEETGVMAVDTDSAHGELGWDYVADLRRYTTLQLARRLNRPALVLQGKHDTSVDWRGAVELVTTARCEQLELHLFADGDHRLADRMPQLWALMASFLSARQLLVPALAPH